MTDDTTRGGCPADHEHMTAEDFAKLPTPPGSDGLPLVGHTLDYVRDSTAFAEAMRREHGSPFYAYALGSKMVIFKKPDANRWIFAGENDYLQNRWSKPIRMLLGQDSVALLQGEAHRERRAVLNPYFRYEQMDVFIPTIRQTAERHIAGWAVQEVTTSAEANRDLAFEIIARYIFGDIQGLPLEALRDDFVAWTRGILTVGVNLPFTPFGRALAARKRLWDRLTRIVEDFKGRADLPPSVLRSLLEARDADGKPFPVGTIVDELQILLFAGHDTTVAALTNIMILLAQHPEVAAAAQAEQAEGDPAHLTTARGLKNYPYLDAIINEGLRMYAPVRGAFRQMTEDRCYAGYHIPEGWVVGLRIAGTHHNAEVWDDPDVFDPGRFLRGEHKREPFMYIPFGGGPRTCLGANFAMTVMRLTLAILLRGYRWELLPDQDLERRVLPTPLPKDGGLMRFEAL